MLKMIEVLTLLFVFSAIAIFPADSNANGESTQYYIGDSIITMNSGEVYRSPYLDARTTNQSENTLTEVVVSRGQSGYKENSAVMKINGNHFTMTESTGTVTGRGDFTGPVWKWTFLKAEFKVSGIGLRIVDYNFLAAPNSIEGHKDFYVAGDGGQGEVLSMQEDVLLRTATAEEYSKKRSELLGHN